MNYILFIFLIACSSFQPSSEKQEIMSQINRYIEGWNNSDGKVFAESFSKDTRFINIFTMKLDGQDAVEKRHQLIFDTFLKGTIFQKNNIEIRFLENDIALVNVDWKLEHLKCKQGKICPENGTFTHVFQKKENKWLIVSTQNTYKP